MYNLKCCGVDSRWVENVPGKGYFYCGECKNEIKEFVGGFKIFGLKKEASFHEIFGAIAHDAMRFFSETGEALTGVVLCKEHVKTLNHSVLYLPSGSINILHNWTDPEGKYYPLGVRYLNY